MDSPQEYWTIPWIKQHCEKKFQGTIVVSKYIEGSGKKALFTFLCIRCCESFSDPVIMCLYRDRGCPKCSLNTATKYGKRSQLDVLLQCDKLHGGKYIYLYTVYQDMYKLFKFWCINCRTYKEVYPHNHCRELNPSGCDDCGKETTRKKLIQGLVKFTSKSKSIYGDLYDYSKVIYVNKDTNVILICSVHGDFEVTPGNHLRRGSGCPKCGAGGFSEISLEYLKMVRIGLQAINADITFQSMENFSKEYRIPNSYYHADGMSYNPNTKQRTIYEFHGTMWHGYPGYYMSHWPFLGKGPSTYGNRHTLTLEKEFYIKSLGFGYIQIWEHEWLRFKNIIKKFSELIHIRRWLHRKVSSKTSIKLIINNSRIYLETFSQRTRDPKFAQARRCMEQKFGSLDPLEEL